MTEYQGGDIVEYKNNKAQSDYAVLLACHNNHAEAVRLSDIDQGKNDHKIMFRTLMHADAAKVFWVTYDRIQVVGMVPDEAYDNLMRHVGTCLGIRQESAKAPIKAEADAERLTRELAAYKAKIAEQERELIKTAAERDVYKDLYTEVIKL